MGLSLAFVILLVIFPGLDLRIGEYFYDAAARTFPWRANLAARIARETAMIIAWAICFPSIAAVVYKIARPSRPLLVRGRTVAFFLITIILTAGILTNGIFKSNWGRPRPVAVNQFSGPWEFKQWWDPTGQCPRNCSFFSGEAATAFWTYAPAALTPPPWRAAAYAGATLFGLATGGLRIAFGGHFFSDVIVAGLVTFLMVWLVHGLIYRWPRTRISDEDIDATLTGWAMRLRSLGSVFSRKTAGQP